MSAPVIASVMLLATAAGILYERKHAADLDAAFNEMADESYQDYFADRMEETAQVFDIFTGGVMKLSAMSKVTAADVAHPNVQAFLRVIRRGEGTSDENGYRRLFGGELFDNFAVHPNKTVTKSGYTSTAAGAFQFLFSTWRETADRMALTDFTPASQTRGAVGRIAARGALDDVKAGRFETAIRKCAKEWASLPFSPYGQPTLTLATAVSVYAATGGKFA